MTISKDIYIYISQYLRKPFLHNVAITNLIEVRCPRKIKSSSGFRLFVPFDGNGLKLNGELPSNGAFLFMLLVYIVRRSVSESFAI